MLTAEGPATEVAVHTEEVPESETHVILTRAPVTVELTIVNVVKRAPVVKVLETPAAIDALDINKPPVGIIIFVVVPPPTLAVKKKSYVTPTLLVDNAGKFTTLFAVPLTRNSVPDSPVVNVSFSCVTALNLPSTTFLPVMVPETVKLAAVAFVKVV